MPGSGKSGGGWGWGIQPQDSLFASLFSHWGKKKWRWRKGEMDCPFQPIPPMNKKYRHVLFILGKCNAKVRYNWKKYHKYSMTICNWNGMKWTLVWQWQNRSGQHHLNKTKTVNCWNHQLIVKGEQKVYIHGPETIQCHWMVSGCLAKHSIILIDDVWIKSFWVFFF